MILENKESNIQKVGDFTEYNIGIEKENIQHIINLLSTNLYSNPEYSFIRETVSNAWDSQIEAKTTDLPIIIKFDSKTDSNNIIISIRDFGTGISPTRFKEIYCNFGSSTKRESNNYIGAFGIGRFAALACTNTAFINSYYNGILYSYVILKDDNLNITFNLINSVKTDEKNGLEVIINVPYNIKYWKALNQLIYFPNIYIDDKVKHDDSIEKINKSQIKRFKYFAYSSYKTEYEILLGNVLYPLDMGSISQHLNGFEINYLKNLKDANCVLTFNIGELSITPNRESLIYNSETINKIKEKINNTYEELENKIDKHFTQNDNSFAVIDVYDWISYNEGNIYYDIANNKISTNKFKNYYATFKERKINLFIKGKSFIYTGDYFNILNDISNDILFFYKRFKYASYYRSIKDIHKCFIFIKDFKYLILVKNITRYPKSFIDYLTSKYKDKFIICSDFSKEDIYNKIFNNNGKYSNINDKVKKEISFILDDYFHKKCITEDLNSEEYKCFLKTYKKKINKKAKDIIILHEHENEYYTKGKTFNNISEGIKYLKSFKKGILLTYVNEGTKYYSFSQYKKWKVFSCRKDIFEQIISYNIPCIIDFHKVFKEDKIFNLIANFKNFVDKNYVNYNNAILTKNFELYCNILPNNILEKYMVYTKLFKQISIPNNLLREKINDESFIIDSEFVNFFTMYFKQYNTFKKMLQDYDLALYNICNEKIFKPLIIHLVIKLKLFKIDYSVYNKAKNTKISKLLW